MRILHAVLILALPSSALASDPSGTWRTEANEEGSYLEVTIAPCATDAAKLCGTITTARDKAGAAQTDYAHLGRVMINDMVPAGENAWAKGTIWAPDEDETYRSKMELNGDVLTVKGCIAGGLICRGQDWTRVQ
jgi:uncharacterized protein (DUF2147 family)